MRYVIELVYKGTAYAGWQLQPNAVSVQEALDRALGVVLRHPVFTLGAGRTDAGVHASQMFAHFDTEADIPQDFVYRTNAILPQDIAVKEVYIPEKQDFNARFDAVRRSYIYRISRLKDPFIQEIAILDTSDYHMDAMQEAAGIIMRYTDFAAFCKTGGNQKTTLCTMYKSEWHLRPDLWEYHVSANRFLRGMVRAIVGSLLMVGKGQMSVAGFEAMIRSGDRRLAGPNVGAKGLTLTEVAYPEGMLKKWKPAG